MNDQTTKMIVFAGGAALIYLFAKKMNVFGSGATTGTTTPALIAQVGGTTSTGGAMGGTTAAVGVGGTTTAINRIEQIN